MREKKRLSNMLATEADLIRRGEEISTYFELAREGESVGAELQRDWRRSTGQPLGVAMSAHLPFASFGRGTYEANQKRGSR